MEGPFGIDAAGAHGGSDQRGEGWIGQAGLVEDDGGGRDIGERWIIGNPWRGQAAQEERAVAVGIELDPACAGCDGVRAERGGDGFDVCCLI